MFFSCIQLFNSTFSSPLNHFFYPFFGLPWLFINFFLLLKKEEEFHLKLRFYWKLAHSSLYNAFLGYNLYVVFGRYFTISPFEIFLYFYCVVGVCSLFFSRSKLASNNKGHKIIFSSGLLSMFSCRQHRLFTTFFCVWTHVLAGFLSATIQNLVFSLFFVNKILWVFFIWECQRKVSIT